jgi:SET domain-containing protein
MASRSASAPCIDPRYAAFRLRIARSRIHRRGVFACQSIPARRKIIEYAGERIGRVENRRRFLRAWRARGQKLIYLARLDSYWWIDGAVGGSGAECINHSCDPNVVVRRIKGHLVFFSCRRISAGDELTVDYQFPKDGPRVPCRCGSRRCRGTINLS